MSRTFARRILFVVVALVLGTGLLAARGQTVFRAGRDLVRVYATVTDQAGHLVTTLERDVFEIRDDGVQPIAVFDNTPTPIQIVVLLDVSGSMDGTLPLLQDSANELFKRLRPDDLVRVGYFGATLVLASPFTRDVAVLRAALPTMRNRDPSATALWRSLVRSMQEFNTEAPERPVILVISDGKDTDAKDRQAASINHVIDGALRGGVMIYSVGVQGRSPTALSGGTGTSPGGFINSGAIGLMSGPNNKDDAEISPNLHRIADATGGGYIEVTKRDNLAAAFARIADELHSQYLLGYVPPKTDGKEHKIGVRVNLSGMRVRARKAYIAPRGESK